MKIATWNVNSIKTRLPLVLEWCARNHPDLLLLQETKTVNETFPKLEFEAAGYQCALFGQKSYNGVAVLSRFPIVDTQTGLPGNLDHGEARYIEATVQPPSGAETVLVASIYVPMGQSVLSERFPFKLAYLDSVRARAQALMKQGKTFVFGGDYNVAPNTNDVYDAQKCEGHILFHPEERRHLRALFNCGLTDAVRSIDPNGHLYSWWDYRANAWERDNGMRIDHLLLSPRAADRLKGAGIDRTPRGWERPSDHVPVWCELE